MQMFAHVRSGEQGNIGAWRDHAGDSFAASEIEYSGHVRRIDIERGIGQNMAWITGNVVRRNNPVAEPRACFDCRNLVDPCAQDQQSLIHASHRSRSLPASG